MPAHITASTSPGRLRGADEPIAAAGEREDDLGVSLALLGLSSTGPGCGPVASVPVEVSPRHTGVMATVIAPGGDVDIALAAGGQVTAILEALAQLAPAQPVRSLRQSTRAAALRSARACYDHLAGKLGVQLTQALIDCRALTATDGIPDNRRRADDRLSSQLAEHPWVLGPCAADVFAGLGVAPDRLAADYPSRRPLLRFCLDWSEQRHHLAGRLGADVLTALLVAGWVTRAQGQRSVQLTLAGRQALASGLGLDV
jgi:hypothetical protein